MRQSVPFIDRAVFNAAEKTAVSVRDGVLEYLGSEIGMEPPDQVFTIYRSPATVANAAMHMVGIPVTNEHVPTDLPPPTEGGSVLSSEMFDANDPGTRTTIAVRNKLNVADTLLPLIEAGKRELSLAGHADLVEHEGDFDFEQRNIRPHHLAAVQQGRAGPLCSFLDSLNKPKPPEPKPMKIHAAFTDAEGVLSLEKIVEIATALPDAIKSVPVDKLQKVMPMLAELVKMSRGVAESDAATGEEGEELKKAVNPPATADEELKKAVNPPATADKEMDEDGNPIKKAVKDEDDMNKPKFSDADFKDAVAKAAEAKAKEFADVEVKRHTAVIEKARDFLPDEYSFSDKDTAQIMRDALATQSTDTFADEELALAFKLLRKQTDYAKFGDNKPAGTLEELKDKDL